MNIYFVPAKMLTQNGQGIGYRNKKVTTEDPAEAAKEVLLELVNTADSLSLRHFRFTVTVDYMGEE